MEADEEISRDAGEETGDEHEEREHPDRARGDEEGTQFDITIAATHSYMGPEVSAVRGRSVLEAGWRGAVPALAHHSAVFPGDTVPALLTSQRDADLLAAAVGRDKLFALLYPDESGDRASGYGVLCEVFEAGSAAEGGLQLKARALHRVWAGGAALVPYVAPCSVRVLPEPAPLHALHAARLAALDPHRTSHVSRVDSLAGRLDAALTPWPKFLYDMYDPRRLRALLEDHFATLHLEHMLPEDGVALSFWVSSNLTVSTRNRLRLFTCDSALLRLRLACDLIRREPAGWLCCGACGAQVARHEDVFAMSSEGVHSTYTNPGGYMHSVVTVRAARGTRSLGAASQQYSWFPGYSWRVLQCDACGAHIGWRFTAARPTLRPAAFYGLCRNYVTPDYERQVSD